MVTLDTHCIPGSAAGSRSAHFAVVCIPYLLSSLGRVRARAKVSRIQTSRAQKGKQRKPNVRLSDWF